MDTPFVSHGIDIYRDRSKSNELWIHAISHPPLETCFTSNLTEDCSASSRVEIFLYDLTSAPPVAKHIKTVLHLLINTPNDVYSLSTESFLVTNDHHYRHHGILRTIEDFVDISLTSWTNVIKVDGEKVEVAISGLHNSNGLGHGPEGEIMLVSAAGGALQLVSPYPDLKMKQRIQFPNTLDNPTYFSDPYASSSKYDASGYILAGLTRGIELGHQIRDPDAKIPGAVWRLSRNESGSDGWERKMIWEDDGAWMTTPTTALIVPIDPALEGGRKLGWLVVTGFSAKAIGVLKIDL